MGTYPEDKVAGEELTAAEMIKVKNTSGLKDLDAGETIDGAILPVAVYQDASDNEVYACDGNDTTKLQFIGFAITDSTDGNSIIVQASGVVSGFTGLTEGVDYYIQDDKTIGATEGTYILRVGKAISETEILIIQGEKGLQLLVASDILRASADTERSGSGILTKKKEILIREAGTIRVKFDLKSTDAQDAQGVIYKNGTTYGTDRYTGNTYETFSEDLEFEVGDLIQLYASESGSNGYTVRNFRLYYDRVGSANYVVNTD